MHRSESLTSFITKIEPAWHPESAAEATKLLLPKKLEVAETGLTMPTPELEILESAELAHAQCNYQLEIVPVRQTGPKARYNQNVEAIKVLKKVEAEDRQPTDREREILTRYVGWGGAQQAFDSRDEKWKKEYLELKELLSADEYVDCPWVPAAIEQREGRGLRQGNENAEVAVYRYVTEGTFDAYLWATVENKQRFISKAI